MAAKESDQGAEPEIERLILIVERNGALLLPRSGSPRALDLNDKLIEALAWLCQNGLKKGRVDTVIMGSNEGTRVPDKERASAWTAVKDPQSGRSFYANKFTKCTTWTSPFELQTPDWVEHSDKEGNKFYVNKGDHRSSWERPTDFNTSARRAPGAVAEMLKQKGVATTRVNLPASGNIQEGLDAVVKCIAEKNGEAQRTAVIVLLNSDRDFKAVNSHYQTSLGPKYTHLRSFVALPIRKRKVKEYVQDIMTSVIETQLHPKANELVNWDLVHGQSYKGAVLESKWQNKQNRKITETSSAFEGIKHKYKILKDPLGQGAFGKVFRALRDDGQPVAVKVYIKEEIEKQDMTFAVTKELGIIVKLNRPVSKEEKREPGHPNVLSIMEWFQSDNRMYVIMEVAEGGAFFDKVNHQLVNKGPFKEAEALPYFIQLIQGLGYMHEMKYVHRDLKPENMLLGGPTNTTIKLCDFGLSTWVKKSEHIDEGDAQFYKGRSKGSKGTPPGGHKKRGGWSIRSIFGINNNKGGVAKGRRQSLTPENMTSKAFKMLQSRVGTPHYVAPEVLTGNGYDGFEADIWSCGVILYILLVGSFPFDKAIIEDFIGCIRENRPFDVSNTFMLDQEYLEPLHENARDLIRQMLDTDPKKRITLAEMMAHPWVRQDEKIVMEGELTKRRNLFDKKYWCVLGKGEFKYYDGQAKKVLHHAVHIGECNLVAGTGADMSITIIDRHHDGKMYKFMAKNAKSRDDWRKALVLEAVGHKEGEVKGESSIAQMGANQMEVYLDEANKMLLSGVIDDDTFELMRKQAMQLIVEVVEP